MTTSPGDTGVDDTKIESNENRKYLAGELKTNAPWAGVLCTADSCSFHADPRALYDTHADTRTVKTPWRAKSLSTQYHTLWDRISSTLIVHVTPGTFIGTNECRILLGRGGIPPVAGLSSSYPWKPAEASIILRIWPMVSFSPLSRFSAMRLSSSSGVYATSASSNSCSPLKTSLHQEIDPCSVHPSLCRADPGLLSAAAYC